ncbi:MAG: hypothetical protein AAFP69_16330, partial [Planctomycetota bacterium]
MALEHEIPTNHRYQLQERYMELTRVELPAEARKRGWAIQEDHCFMRIILDQLFHDCWYAHLDRRLTAYKQLNEDQLQSCITMANQILAGDQEKLERWNQQSLK